MKLFIQSVLISVFAIGVSFIGLIGSESYGLISVFIVAFFVHEKIAEFFEKNRINIIEKKMNSRKENLKTFKNIFIIFFGIACAYGGYMYLFSSQYLLDTFRDLLIRAEYLNSSKVHIASISSILLTNISILLISGVFTAIFREYAVSLFVALGSVFFGLSTGYVMSITGKSITEIISSIFLIILPGSFVVFSLIILSVGVYFLVKGYQKHGKISKNNKKEGELMKRIFYSFLIILSVALMVNILGTMWESTLLPIILK